MAVHTYYLHYLANKLPDKNKKIHRIQNEITINGYNIRAMKKPHDRLRGCRPEFIYYIGDYNVLNNNVENKQIEMDTKTLSIRNEPIRYIDKTEEIDLREFIDDDYALLKCVFKKLKWKDKFKYVWLKVRNKLRKEQVKNGKK